MRPRDFGLILLIFAAISCGGRQDKMSRDQQNYDVVQEGSTAGGTANLNAPGETAAPMTTSAATATNVDTTTAFTLPGTATTTSTAPPGTIAGSLPTSSSGSISGYPPPRQPAPRPRVERPSQPPMNSSTSTVAPSQQTEGPPTTDTAAPPTTDTQSRKDRNKDRDQQQPPPTDTSTPPTTTSTQGL